MIEARDESLAPFDKFVVGNDGRGIIFAAVQAGGETAGVRNSLFEVALSLIE